MPEVTRELDRTIYEGSHPPMRFIRTPLGIVKLFSWGDFVVCRSDDDKDFRINGVTYHNLRIDFALNEVTGAYEKNGSVYMSRPGSYSSSDYTPAAMDKVYKTLIPCVTEYMRDHWEFAVQGHIHNNRRKIEREVAEYDSLIKKALESKEKLNVLVREGQQWYNPILPKRNWVVDGTFASNGVGVPSEK